MGGLRRLGLLGKVCASEKRLHRRLRRVLFWRAVRWLDWLGLSVFVWWI